MWGRARDDESKYSIDDLFISSQKVKNELNKLTCSAWTVIIDVVISILILVVVIRIFIINFDLFPRLPLRF